MKTPPQSMNRIVLIVDDDSAYRSVLTMALKGAGYQAIAVENGERAMPLVKELKPDVILLDMLMPVMDGMQFLRWLREKAKVTIPTIVLTCMDKRTVAVDALIAGATEVITKPFSLQALLKKLSTCM